mgnify:FL=1
MIAPEVTRQRLLIEGYFDRDCDEQTVRDYFSTITKELKLRTYGDPVIHSPSGDGKESNQGYDAFVPLIDSGIYVGVWTNAKFFSTIIFTCKEFSQEKAIAVTKQFWNMDDAHTHEF